MNPSAQEQLKSTRAVSRLGGRDLSLPRTPHSALRTSPGFTLLELLVVIAIIGLVATIGLPAIKGMTKSNAMVAADRQLLDDLAYARQRAIADHTTVYMVFVPPSVVNNVSFPVPTDPVLAKMMTGLYQGQYTTYALFSNRSVGEQPGLKSPRYLTPWKSLPGGVYIATNKYVASATVPNLAPTFYQMQFPFPVATNPPTGKGQFFLPYIAFNYLGQLVYTSGGQDVLVAQAADSQQHEYIPLARGSIFYARDVNGAPIAQAADIQETPAGNAYYVGYNSTSVQTGQQLIENGITKEYNQIYIDPLTGKARIQRQEIQ